LPPKQQGWPFPNQPRRLAALRLQLARRGARRHRHLRLQRAQLALQLGLAHRRGRPLALGLRVAPVAAPVREAVGERRPKQPLPRRAEHALLAARLGPHAVPHAPAARQPLLAEPARRELAHVRDAPLALHRSPGGRKRDGLMLGAS
jgi:hypothetical protein